jgi:hypothetical protein
MSNTIIVGCDGSKVSSEALDWAASEAQRHGASLKIIACFEVPLTESFAVSFAADVYDILVERT